MSNTFIYESGWLVEKPETMPYFWLEYKSGYREECFNENELKQLKEFEKFLTTLRRFKYDYPCEEGKEMELGKHFEVVINPNGAQHHFAPNIAIPITQRTYSEQDLLDTWNACRTYMKQWEQFKHYDDAPSMTAPDKQQFFKQKFGIEIK